MKRKWSSRLFWAVGAAENCHKYATFWGVFFKFLWAKNIFKILFLSTKSWKNYPQKLHTYGSWEVFFSAAPPAQNSPELHFRFIIFFIQPSLLKSLSTLHSLQNDFAEFSFIFIRDTTENCVDLIALQFFVQVFSRQKERS